MMRAEFEKSLQDWVESAVLDGHSTQDMIRAFANAIDYVAIHGGESLRAVADAMDEGEDL